jgi:hypothetical protein
VCNVYLLIVGFGTLSSGFRLADGLDNLNRLSFVDVGL